MSQVKADAPAQSTFMPVTMRLADFAASAMIRFKFKWLIRWHIGWVEGSATKSQLRLHLDCCKAMALSVGACSAPRNAVPCDQPSPPVAPGLW
jgi:hypothetical protein